MMWRDEVTAAEAVSQSHVVTSMA